MRKSLDMIRQMSEKSDEDGVKAYSSMDTTFPSARTSLTRSESEDTDKAAKVMVVTDPDWMKEDSTLFRRYGHTQILHPCMQEQNVIIQRCNKICGNQLCYDSTNRFAQIQMAH